MSLLTFKHLKEITESPSLSLPHIDQFNLPAKILQFGTGVLLRGLPDYFVEKANNQGVFNGRIVVIKSTDNGDISPFENQDYLYTLHIQGIKNGKKVEEDVICSSIKNIFSVKSHWQVILDAAADPSIQIIISNTTEAGLQYLEEKLTDYPSHSFPGKLLQCLMHRFKILGNTPESKIVILPTELLTDNGMILKGIIDKLIQFNELPSSFTHWINQYVIFANTLVDRIVPGKISEENQQNLYEKYGYVDQNAIMCEPYALWAIEGGQEISDLLTFSKVNPEIKIVPDISQFKELKLRILNGSHTLLCAKAISEGFETVYHAMSDAPFKKFAEELIFEEILPSIPGEIKTEDKVRFAKDVIDRFSNEGIEHKWKSIAVQYPMKLTIRVLPLLKNYFNRNGVVPARMVACILEILSFLIDNADIQIDDTSKAIIHEIRLKTIPKVEQLNLLIKEERLWGEDLSKWIKN